MNLPRQHAPGKFWRGLYLIEDGILVALLLMMVLLAVAQILLRNLGDASIVWADPFLRVAVLWIGLLGAMIAARENSHIAIDIATRYLPEKIARVLAVLLALFTSAICALVGWHAFRFVRDEHEYAGMAFAQVPAWICEIIIPLAFAVMALRYLMIAAEVAGGRRALRKAGV